MRQDGLIDQKIANIIKTNKNFDMTMLTNKETIPKAKKRKLQIDERTGNSKSREMNM